jgi:hypothetical protein
MQFNLDIDFNLDDIIYKRKPVPMHLSFGHLSRLARTAHDSINRRYRKFMKFKRSEDGNINKARAKRCCDMVKKHIHDLKWVRTYLKKHNMHTEHPVFTDKINLWIEQCERVHERYKNHLKVL